MLRKYEEHVVYTEEFLSHLDTHYKVIKISDKITELLKNVDSHVHYQTNSPAGYECMITINRSILNTSNSDIICYFLFTIIEDVNINIQVHWGKSVRKIDEEKMSPILLFLRHLISKKEDYGKYYSFSDVVKSDEIDKLISNINMEYFNLYNVASKFNL